MSPTSNPPQLTVYFRGARPICSAEITHYRPQLGAQACECVDAASCAGEALGLRAYMGLGPPALPCPSRRRPIGLQDARFPSVVAGVAAHCVAGAPRVLGAHARAARHRIQRLPRHTPTVAKGTGCRCQRTTIVMANTSPIESSAAGRMGPARIAVLGVGMAGVACAAGLRRAGVEVTVFDKSPAIQVSPHPFTTGDFR